MAGVIVPVAKSLYLCEEVDVEGGLINLYGLFNSLHPRRYPYTRDSFVCFTQLVGGLGHVSCSVEVRWADGQQLIYITHSLPIRFDDRETLLQVKVDIEGCVFEAPGLYLVELYCNNAWVADTTVRLRGPRS